MKILTEKGFKNFDGVICNLTKEVSEIKLSSGLEISATLDHEFLSKEGNWVKCKDIKPGFVFSTGVTAVALNNNTEVTSVYDALNVKDTSSFLANGITAHNCADRIVLDECLAGNTKILMANGEEKKLEDVKIGDFVISEVNGKYSKERVMNHKMTGVKQTYKYVFDDGFTLVATPNHPIFTSKGIVEIDKASDIRVASVNEYYVNFLYKEDMGEIPVYNMTIDRSHNYIANGYLTHNCDDIPEAAIVSIMAIKMTNPDVKVWRSGTPKGEVNLHRAEQDPQNKCFHYPSYVIPHYDDAMDASMRAEMGDGVGYVQEILALGGVASNTVFQSMFINRALNKLIRITAKEVMMDRQRFIIFIGVDWNHDKVGSRLLVVAYDKIVPQFHIIDKERVDVEGFTQYAAVEKIIQLNRKYNCDHVFCDQGFGAAQVADLKMFAMSQAGKVPKGHPDLKLLDVTPVDYGSVTIIQDPVTGAEYKTPTKQLAVQSTVEVFEKNYITLDKDDDKDIVAQLKNYVEKSRNNGRIVYGYISKKVGDHDLDALMIGIFGMKRLYSSLFVGESTQALMKFVNTNNGEEMNIDMSDDVVVGYSSGRSRIHSTVIRDGRAHVIGTRSDSDPYRRKVHTRSGRGRIF